MGSNEYLDGLTEDDNPMLHDEETDTDIDVDDDEEEDDLEEIIKSINVNKGNKKADDTDDETDDDSIDEEEDEEAEEADEEEPEATEEEITPDMEALINNRVVSELNRIVPERLKRDRKTQQVTHLEQLTGMSLEDVISQVTRNMVESKAEELGISVEEAADLLKDKIENVDIKTSQINQQQQDEEINTAMKKVKYLEDKTLAMKKPKMARILSKEIIKEVDKFTLNGLVLTFEDGLNYVLGAKLATGELIDKLQSGAEKKAQASVRKKAASPQPKGSGATKSTVTLSRLEKEFAAQLGISEKDYAVEKYKEINRKQRKLR